MHAAEMALSLDKHDAKFRLVTPYKGYEYVVVANAHGEAGTRIYAAGPAKNEADLSINNYFLPITLMAFESFITYEEALRAIGYELA